MSREEPPLVNPAVRTSSTTAGREERSQLAGRAGIVGLGTLASRVLGLGRDMAQAAIFTRHEMDAFVVAFAIPNVLRQLLGEGGVSSAVVPVLSAKIQNEGEVAAKSFFARIRGASLSALVLVTVLGMVFARPLTELFAGGYHARPGEFERTVALTRMVFPYIFFMGTAALGMAALHTHKRFAVASFAPGLLNVASLAAAFLLPLPLAEAGLDRAYAMAIGALLGGALQVVAQWPALRAIGYNVRPILDLGDPGVREALRRLVPMTFGFGVYYVDLVLSRRFLSELGPGAQSYFYFAQRLCEFPQGVFVMALSTAALPSLSRLAAGGHHDEVRKTYAHGMRLALFVAVPASVALAVLGEPLVAMLFQHGQFDANASHETARALFWQGGTIWAFAAVRQLVPVFHSMGDTRTPTIVSAIDLAVFIALALGLRGPMGHAGVSAAVAGSTFAQMALLFAGLRMKLGTICAGEIGGSVLKTLIAASIAGACAWALDRLISGPLARGFVAATVFSIVFVLAAWGTRSAELDLVLSGARRRLRGLVA